MTCLWIGLRTRQNGRVNQEAFQLFSAILALAVLVGGLGTFAALVFENRMTWTSAWLTQVPALGKPSRVKRKPTASGVEQLVVDLVVAVDGLHVVQGFERVDQLEHLLGQGGVGHGHRDRGDIGELAGLGLQALLLQRLGDGVVSRDRAKHLEVVAVVDDVVGPRLKGEFHEAVLGDLGRADEDLALAGRSEERRVGKECRIGCRSRWSPYH